MRKGLLLEFKKDSERLLLAVVLRPDGKKNWIVSDQVYNNYKRLLVSHLSIWSDYSLVLNGAEWCNNLNQTTASYFYCSWS